MEARLGRNLLIGEALIAAPAQFDAGKEIGLGAGHAKKARRRELGFAAENLGVRMEPSRRAAPVLHLADGLDRASRLAARIMLPIEHLVARHLDRHVVGEGVHHRRADAVEATEVS